MTLRSIGEAVIATDIRGCITCMNPEAERLTGWQFADAKDCNLSDVFKVVNAHSGIPINDLVERVRNEKGIVVLAEDSMLIASNGNRYQIYENGAPIYDDANEIIGVVLVFRDITQEYDLKNCLNENALRLQRVVDTSMDAVIVIDEQGMVDEWNPAAENIFGWSYAEIRKQPLHNLIIPKEFRERHLQGIQKLIKDDETSFKSKRIESLALHRDGHTFPIDLAMTSIKTENGWVFNAFIRDLSDHKNNEKLIDKHNIILRETQRIAQLGYWELDLVNGVLEWSDEIFRMFDLDPATSEPSYGLFINKIHPEDRERVDAAYSQSLKTKKAYNIIHRIVTNKGIRIVHEQCDTDFDDDGKPIRSLGMVQDITERVDNLDELRIAATMFRTHSGIIITDKNGTIVRVNPAFEEMTGYSSKELVGKNPKILKSDRQSKEFYEVMWNKLSATGVWQGELWNTRKDGTLFAEWLTVTVVKDDAGEVTNYVGTSQDITERKHAETKIEYLAYHDDLTDLANRRLLIDRLQQNIVTCKRNDEFGAVLILDLDSFKDLNDSLGHSVGDEVLRGVASRLKEVVREGDTVARLGGDEFIVVLSSIGKDPSKIGIEVQLIAEKIQSNLSRPYKLKDGQCFSNA
ncbi:MAG: PAS domain S-box protein, partial [Proteobacteria bacterium]|nr:PAS domain S-box protein [Pseudomonadota bacterium]